MNKTESFESFETLFSKNTAKSSKILEKIRNNNLSDIFEGLGYIKSNSLIMDYKYFKYFATAQTYDTIIQYIDHQINHILNSLDNTNDTFNIYIDMNSLSIVDIEKHRMFFIMASKLFSEKYPNLLNKCFIYNAPYIFEKLFSMISMFIDKDTQSKIYLV